MSKTSQRAEFTKFDSNKNGLDSQSSKSATATIIQDSEIFRAKCP